MKKLFLFLFLAVLPGYVWAGGLNASFQNSRFSSSTLNDRDTVAEYHGVVSGTNVLIDFSGANNLQWSEAFDNAAWTKSNVTVTADQVRGPESWMNNADLLTPTAADSYVYQDDAAAAAGETHTCSFQLRTVTGNINLSIHVYNQAHGAIRETRAITVTPHWRLYQVQGVLIAGDTAVGCTIGGGATWGVGENIYAVRGQSQENDEWRTGAGVYHYTDATIKPTHDLAQTNAPTTARAHLQSGGNKMAAREFDGVNQFYSVVHHASMDINDGDHTYTFFIQNAVVVAGFNCFFSHGSSWANGIFMRTDVTGNEWEAIYNRGGSSVDVVAAGNVSDGYYHVVQLVRSDNQAKLCVDGVCGASVDVTIYGIDGNKTLYIGQYDTGIQRFDGQISYTCIRSRALSADELAQEREQLLGIYTNWSSVNAWDFSRSTTAYKTFSNAYENNYPSHSMDLVAVDAPRVAGQGSGILIEGGVTQLHGYTEAFNSWTQSGTCAVTADDYDAPNGTTTADELDNTGGVNTDHRYIQPANFGALAGRIFTGSVWIRATTPHNCTIAILEGGIGATTQTYYVTQELQRFTVQRTCIGGGTGLLRLRGCPGENGVATGVAHFWGANLTETTFPTSYIPNAGAATSQVTKTADDISILVLEANTNNRILADEYCQNCAADKITLYGEWKAEWSSNADIGADRRLVNMGNVASANNDLELYVSSAGNVFLRFQDDAGTVRTINSAANPVDFSNWFSVRGVVDFTDLSRSELYINEAVDHAADSGNWTAGGGATYNTDGNEIRIGATRTGAVDGFHWTRRLRESNDYIPAP